METINQRLEALREVMQQEHIAAFIFPSTDAHNSEYVAPHWKGREWISGFNGSAGTAVVTLKSAALWTDSRYFLAAEQQLAGTEYELAFGTTGRPFPSIKLNCNLLSLPVKLQPRNSTEYVKPCADNIVTAC